MENRVNDYQYARGQIGFFPMKGWTDERKVGNPW